MKILHVFSDVDQSHLIKTFGLAMDRTKYEVGFVFLGRSEPGLHEVFRREGLRSEFLKFESKRDYPAAILKVRKLLKEIRPDVVHTHLVEGSIVGLTAAKLAGIKRRVHTRHHGIESHIYYPHGVYYDRYNNRLSKKIVAISKVVADVLIELENVPRDKVVTIPHGFHLENFTVDPAVTISLKEKYGLDGHYPVIGSIARFIHWKGVHNTVLAFKRVLADYPDAKLVLANAVGPYTEEINRLLTENIPERNYVKFEFEPQIFSLYPAFDVFVHVPVEEKLEAFGLVYIEPLTLKVPSVFTLSGIANDFIKNDENAVVVPYNDPDATADGIIRIVRDSELRSRITDNGHKDVWERFRWERLADDLDHLYSHL